ncbi:hypothetical protein [Paenibacillus lactis]|uniref:hypothetical protein n=1 Tax=Paenibacillus lactis TaxID=228574 RepID=UPI003D761C82
MKKTMIVVGILVVLGLAGLHFGTFQNVKEETLPISNIGTATINYMKINYQGKVIKTPFSPEFTLIKDEKFGDTNGTFTLIQKQNIFGSIKYEAVYNKK